MNRKITFTLLAMLTLLSACETMNGLGKDTQKLGNSISGAAEKNK